VITDLRSRKILDVVTLPALAVTLLAYGVQGGAGEVLNSLAGLAICAVPFAIASVPGWIGMGDVKLMALVGAVAGWPLGVMALVYVSVAGGAQALAQLVWARLRGRERPKYVPYAVAIAAGTVLALVRG
jgi:prepilin peptidase CpaA